MEGYNCRSERLLIGLASWMAGVSGETRDRGRLGLFARRMLNYQTRGVEDGHH
jgi:hypothetical protein